MARRGAASGIIRADTRIAASLTSAYLCMQLCMCMISDIVASGFMELKAGVLVWLQKRKISCASNTWCRARA